MKKKSLFILIPIVLVIAFLILTSKPVRLLMGGFKEPEVEKVENIQAFAQAYRKDILAVCNSKNSFQTLQKDLEGFPSIFYFDKNLNLIKSSSGTGCPKTGKAFFTQLDKNKAYEKEPNNVVSLTKILSEIIIIQGDSSELSNKLKNKDFDFIILYTWAKMLPKQSKQMMEVGNEAANNTKSKTVVISLNLDYSILWMNPEDIPH